MKIERLTDCADNSGAGTLSNYHSKTLMLWACELKSKSWWSDNINLVRMCVQLLHVLAEWLTDAWCQHYFISNCNLIDNSFNMTNIGYQLMSTDETWLSTWSVDNYIRKCSQLTPHHISRLLDDATRPTAKTKVQNAASAVAVWRQNNTMLDMWREFLFSEYNVAEFVNLCRYCKECSLGTARSCACWITELEKLDSRLSIYFIAVAFLHVACRLLRHGFNDELMDILATLRGQFPSRRRYPNNSTDRSSLGTAVQLMKVVANKSLSTMSLIEIELSKAYLYRALRCKDSDSDSIYCLANVYLAVLYYTTGQYQTAIDHCTLVTRSQDHSQCSSHVVQGEILPKIDDYVDTVLGLAELYQYVLTAVLNNHQHQTKYVTGFTAELFASYLNIKCLSVTECRQFMQTSSNDKFERYAICIRDIQQLLIGDVLLFLSVCRLLKFRRIPVCPKPQHTPINANNYYRPTSDLVELLQKSAVEYLTTYRQLEARDFGSVGTIVTTDFEALYAYKRGDYQRCLQLSTQNVHTLLCGDNVPDVAMLPEFVQFLDGDIVSLTALTVLINPECRNANKHRCIVITQGTLSLYLMTQCQLKLRRSVTVLTDTLDYIELIQSKHRAVRTLDHMTLKLIERRVTEYVSTHFVAVDPAVTIRPTS